MLAARRPTAHCYHDALLHDIVNVNDTRRRTGAHGSRPRWAQADPPHEMSPSPRAAAAVRALLCATALGNVGCGGHTAHSPSAVSEAGERTAGLASRSSVATTTDATPATTRDAPMSALPPAAMTPGAIAPPSVAPPIAASNCLPSHDGYLRLRMRGDRNLDIDWHDADMQCDGGPRPGQQGIRLTFAGPRLRGGHRLRFVFGIAAAAGVHAARNVPTNVTVIFEGEQKLYSTAGDDKCTMDQFSEQPLSAPGHAHLQRISARGFCTAPAMAVAGKTGLLLSRFDFAGAVVDEDLTDEPVAAKP
ncbi:MAG: hypothetical protein ACHQDD_06340 [Steroidobacterales bacterium]